MSQVAYNWQDYKSDVSVIWCPGCGDFGVLNALYHALAGLGLPPEKVAIVSGIGCSSRIPGYIKTYGFNSIHGRALPIAQGLKYANPDLTVIAAGGDGDGLAIGGGHFPHACRRNANITYIMMDNGIYGLTKGQTSPTTPYHMKTKSSYYGNPEPPLNASLLALSYNSSFVARGFSGNTKLLKTLMIKAIQHKGFSFIQVLSPCVTFRGSELFKYYRQHTELVPEEHDPTDKLKAYALAGSEDPIYLGIFYREERKTIEEEEENIIHMAKKDREANFQGILRDFSPV